MRESRYSALSRMMLCSTTMSIVLLSNGCFGKNSEKLFALLYFPHYFHARIFLRIRLKFYHFCHTCIPSVPHLQSVCSTLVWLVQNACVVRRGVKWCETSLHAFDFFYPEKPFTLSPPCIGVAFRRMW